MKTIEKTRKTVTITAKLRLYVNEEASVSLLDTIAAYTKACNYVSSVVFETKQLVQPKLHAMTYEALRADYSMKSQMAQSVMKAVIARYRSAKSNKHDWSLIKFERGEYDLVWNRDYSLSKEGVFSLNTVDDGRIKTPFAIKAMEKYFDGTWEFGTAKLIYKDKKFYLHIPMTKKIVAWSHTRCSDVFGVDVGMNYTAVSYNSKGEAKFYKGRHVKDKRSQFAKTRKELQTRGTSSSRRRLKKIGQRENRWMNDHNHCISKALVANCRENALIVLEDLSGVRGSTEKVKRKNRYNSVSWSYFDLGQKISYKAEMIGKKVIFVDPKYTSQCCPKCGHTNRYNRDKKRHTFKCRMCSYRSNDDRIGAMNLHRKGIEYIHSVALQTCSAESGAPSIVP